jgi:hypothetical protein
MTSLAMMVSTLDASQLSLRRDARGDYRINGKPEALAKARAALRLINFPVGGALDGPTFAETDGAVSTPIAPSIARKTGG